MLKGRKIAHRSTYTKEKDARCEKELEKRSRIDGEKEEEEGGSVKVWVWGGGGGGGGLRHIFSDFKFASPNYHNGVGVADKQQKQTNKQTNPVVPGLPITKCRQSAQK